MTSTKTTEGLDQKIWKLFKGRCLLNPSHPGEVIHEIEFRSQKPNDWTDPENRVLLCNECHNLVHSKDIALWKMELTKLRKEWIERYG